MLSQLHTLTQRIALIVVPVPVIAGSMMLSTWAHTDPHAGARRNEVYTRVRPTPSAAAWLASNVEPRQDYSAALENQCKQKAQRLRSQLGRGAVGRPTTFHVIVRTPFVIAGDLEPADLQRIYQETIRPAAGAMHGEYFTRRPTEPVSMLLLSDEVTYRGCARALFGQTRTPVYGYYKPSLRTVVINLAAGGGTIVHELTHALIDFDCPHLPIWINEGIASLHEECRLVETPNGFRIQPLVNWRLTVLQQAIASQTIRPTRELMMLDQMVGNHEALNYAHARYFCMYLNEMGLLDDLYRLVRDNPDTDGSDSRALRSLISDLSGYGLDEDFQRWVMRLRLDS
jgi:hypothetical protein